MFLFQSIKRVIKELPKVNNDDDEGWDVFEELFDKDESSPASYNYDPLIDPGSWYNTIDHRDD